MKVTAATIAAEEPCPTCTAAAGTPCYFDAFERLGADGRIRDRVGEVHPRRADAWNARHVIGVRSPGPNDDDDHEPQVPIEVRAADASTHEAVVGVGDYEPRAAPPGCHRARRLPSGDEQSLGQSEDDES